MVVLDYNLLRKRSEHHDDLLSDLEEISLHQEEIEKIDFIGGYCRHLRILLLQNNVISKIENIHRLKELEYLNLSLNNIARIENLEKCESLRKLDLTLNFIDFDDFEAGISSLTELAFFEDLYLLGNPVTTNWDPVKYRQFVIGCIPGLKQLDGELVAPTERVAARVALPDLRSEVKNLSANVLDLKARGEHKPSNGITREERVEMYREMGREKVNKERAERERLGLPDPKPPREVPSVLNARGEIRQCNEGGYKFSYEETDDSVVFELHVPKYMDSSLIDVDINPTYIRCVVRNKLTQIRLDTEIVVSRSVIERSKSTGVIKVTCPHENPRISKLTNRPVISEDLPPALETINL
jgi:protein TilB